MDDSGRLHMPNGFIGKTFKETGLKKRAYGKVATSLIHDEVDEATRNQVEGAALHGAAELGLNRKARRKLESEMLRKERIG